MIFAIILSYCSLHAMKVFIFADDTVQLVRPKCSFWGDIFSMTFLTNPDILEGLLPWNESVKKICKAI